jgi:hypothetical protein
MKVHHSLPSYYNNPLSSQSDSGSDDSTPFTLPGEDSDQKAAAPSISSSGVPNSISSGFWLNQAGGSGDATGDSADEAASNQAILDEFKKLADMTPAEKIRAQYLEEHHLTEEQFNQLPSDKQKAINDEIAKEIKRTLGADNSADSGDESDSAAAALALA